MRSLAFSWLAILLLALSGLFWLPTDSSNPVTVSIAKAAIKNDNFRA